MGDESGRLGAVAFDSLYEGYARRVLGYCLRRTSPESAEDAVAETFLVAWRRIAEIPSDPLPWLLRVASNVLANQERSARRRFALQERVGSLPSSVQQEHRDHPVLEALATLEPRERDVLLLVAWDGLSSAQAATVVGCSPLAFRLRFHRAKKRFEQAIAARDVDDAEARRARAGAAAKEETG